MTNNKVDKSVRNSMVDDLLSDGDKPKVEVASNNKVAYQSQTNTRSSRGGGHSYNKRGSYPSQYASDGGYASSEPYDWDNAPERKPQTNTTRRTGVGSAMRDEDVARTMAGIVRSGLPLHGNLLVRPDQVQTIVDCMMLDIGRLLDVSGLCWGTEGVQGLKASLQVLVEESLYSSQGQRLVVEDDEWDSETGEFIG